MTTAEALESITGTSEFELFAISALRELEPEFAPIIHTGLNAAGKTIVGPLDGFGRLAGTTLRYGTAAVTTSADLKRKWLAQSEYDFATLISEAGDFVKAAKKAAELRESSPQAQVRVALVTNREVDDDLITAIDEYAVSQDLEYTLISRSRLADYLDNWPNGNYHRGKLFGTLQTRLSWELLHDISAENLELFARELQYQEDAPWTWEPCQDQLSYATSAKQLTYLLADSGRGKSSVSLRVARTIMASGGVALWCKPEYIAPNVSMERILLDVIRAIRPEVDENAGKAALDFASSKQVLLLIDDVNAMPDPLGFCERLTARVATMSKVGSIDKPTLEKMSEQRKHLSFLVPLWPSNAERLLVGDTPGHVSLLSMSAMANEQAADLVAQVSSRHSEHVYSEEPTSIAAAMWNDPYLIAMWGRLWSLDNARPPLANVLQQYVDTLASQAAKSAGILPSEIASVLGNVTETILRTRCLRPIISLLMSGLDAAGQTALRALLKDGRLCRPSSTAAAATLAFQHDRLRDFLLSTNVVRDGLFAPSGDETLTDPIFAEAFALAARFANPTALDTLVEANPLAAAIAIGESNPLDAERKVILERGLTLWWNDPRYKTSGAHRAARVFALDWWAYHATPLVQELLKEQHGTSIYLAISRLGNVESAIRLCSVHSLDFTADWRDSALAEGDRRRDSTFRTGLRNLFRTGLSSDAFRRGAMWLAGYLRDASLTSGVLACWRSVDEKIEALPSAVYAVSRTSQSLVRDMHELLAFWESIDDTRDEHSASPRYWATQGIPYLLSQSGNPELVAWLRYVSETRPELRGMAVQVAQYLFSPDAVIFLAEHYEAVEIEHGYQAARFRAWLDTDHRHVEPSEATLDTLKSQFLDPSLRPARRNFSFQMWANNATPDDLAELRKIDDPAVFEDMILNTRLRLADPSACDSLLERINQGTRLEWWIRFCPQFWESVRIRTSFEEALDRHISGFASSETIESSNNEDYAFAEVLNRVDPAETERIMIPRWRELSTRSQYLQAALAAGTIELNEHFAKTIENAANPGRAFEHVAVIIDNARGRTVRLESLTPYLRYLSSMELTLVAIEANRHTMHAWRAKYVDPLLDDAERKRFGSSDRDWLHRYQLHYNHEHGLEVWLRQLEDEGSAPQRGIAIMRNWYLTTREMAAFDAYNAAVRLNGLREDSDRLEAEQLAYLDDDVAFTRYVVHRRTGYVAIGR